MNKDNLFFTKEGSTLSDILHNIGDALCILDKEMNLLGANKRFTELYEVNTTIFSDDKTINIFDVYPEFKSSVFFEAFQYTIETGESTTRVGYSNKLKKWISSRTTKYQNNKFISISHTLDTGFNQAGYVTNYDGLTSLRNRYGFEHDMNQLISAGIPFGLTVLDIKRFRFLNESFGLEFADMCLMEAAARIKGTTVSTNQVYRIGVDQFALIVPSDKETCMEEIKKVTSEFKKPFKIKGGEYILDVTVGFYYGKRVGETTGSMIKNVEAALEYAKRTKKSYCEFDINQIQSEGKMMLANDLKASIKSGNLKLYYQGQVDSVTGKVCGAEALIRWQHPERGLVSPANFLLIAEEHDLMKEIDRFVILTSFKDAAEFAKKGIHLPISINLSNQMICDEKSISYIEMLLKHLKVNPNMITIEITEGSLMSDVEVSKTVISHLKNIGFKIALDDFGTGYSSISYMVKYPTDYLKIDRSFITNIHQNKNLQTLVTNITKMAHSLGISVVAEGVETREESQMVKQIDCDVIQGYLFAKPESKEEFLKRIHHLENENINLNDIPKEKAE